MNTNDNKKISAIVVALQISCIVTLIATSPGLEMSAIGLGFIAFSLIMFVIFVWRFFCDDSEQQKIATHEVTEKTLVEKIQQLERHVAFQQDELDKFRLEQLGETMALIRLHGAVLMYIGDESIEQFYEQIEQRLGGEVASQALKHLFNLNDFQPPRELKNSIRTVVGA